MNLVFREIRLPDAYRFRRSVNFSGSSVRTLYISFLLMGSAGEFMFGVCAVMAQYLIPCSPSCFYLVYGILVGVICDEEPGLQSILQRFFINSIDSGVWNLCAICDTVQPDLSCLDVYNGEEVIGIVCGRRLDLVAYIP